MEFKDWYNFEDWDNSEETEMLENDQSPGDCHKCGAPLVLRTNSKNGNKFYGCSTYGQTRCTGSRAYSASYGGGQSKPAQQQKPVTATQATQTPQSSRTWIYAKVSKKGDKRFPIFGKEIAASKRQDGHWDYFVLDNPQDKGVIYANEITSGLIQSLKNIKTDQKLSSTNPSLEDLQQQFAAMGGNPEAPAADQATPQPQKQNKKTIPPEQISEEQTQIDQRFSEIIGGKEKQHIMINALAGTGKAQPLYSKILTLNGWKLMGEIKVGDMVFGSDGQPHMVQGVFPQGDKIVYKVIFSDNTSTEACGEHLWFTETKYDRDQCRFYKEPLFNRGTVKTTCEIKDDLFYKNYPKHYVPLVQSLNFPEKDVSINPYLMGILLGDGSFRTGGTTYSTADQEILESVNKLLPIGLKSVHKSKYDYSISSGVRGKKNLITESIRKYNLWMCNSGNKFIPDDYKFNSYENRVALLQGLLDSDGSISKNEIEFTTVSKILCEDFCFLVQSLGGISKVRERYTKYKNKNGDKVDGKLSYRIRVKLQNTIKPFRLSRKLDQYKPHEKYKPVRKIVGIEIVGEKIPCQCISVQSPDHLYVTDNCILTHNTTMLKHLAWKYGKPGQKWLYIVFNTKNKVEASEEFPQNLVDVRTSNGFLGEVLQIPQNINKIGNTDRMINLQNNRSESDSSGGKLEKSRLIADSPEFSALMHKMGLVEKVDSYEYGKIGKTLNSLLKGIRYNFKEAVLQLVGLGKSFALDPRNGAGLDEGINKILGLYDIDTEMMDTKERISKYRSSFRDSVEHYLEEILGYDFMSKDFQKEITQATVWMMSQLMPNATQQRYGQGRLGVELASYRDFDDDLWYTATHANELVWPRYDVVLADEVQDFNENQKIMLQKLSEAGAKIVAVGDPNQCHPGGTMVEITGKGKKPIEEVIPGDEVVVYNTKKSYFPGTLSQGRKVLEVACRPYSGNMIKINAGDYSQSCTPNHRCLVKFDADNKYCLYLMIRGEQGRIGTCRVNYENGFGVGMRARQEGADKSWLLGIFDSDREARVAEYMLSLEFGLPQLIFKNNGQLNPPESYINEVYEKIGNNMERVHKCLEHFGRYFEFPIWTKEQQDRHGKLKQNYLGSKKSFMTQACNLISNYMCVRTFDGTTRGGAWEPVTIENNKFEGNVYSLRVEPTEDNKPIYIADNIVTFNSIYRFRGADGAAFGNLSNLMGQMSEGDGQVVYNLTNNFRSRPEILDFANEETHVNGLKSGRTFADGKKGVVTKGEKKFDDVFSSLGDEVKQAGGKVPVQTAFISRTNEPLVKTALQLLAQKIPFLIVGKDIAKELIKHIRKISAFKRMSDNDPSRSLAAELSAFLDDEKDSHHGKSTKKAYLQETEETTNALLASIDSYESETGGQGGTIGGFKRWISSRLGGLEVDENEKDLRKYKQMIQDQNPVILTTAHKSKGLEFSRVYVLRYDQFPHPKAVREEDLQQEENARYVTLTRAQDELHILDLDGQPGYKGKGNNSGSNFNFDEPSPGQKKR